MCVCEHATTSNIDDANWLILYYTRKELAQIAMSGVWCPCSYDVDPYFRSVW